MSIVIDSIPKHLSEEIHILNKAGLQSWLDISDLKDQEINELSQKTRATSRNLYKLRGIAHLICELKISSGDAALLMHAGIATVKALAASIPHELVQQVGRLERQLNIAQTSSLKLEKANYLITQARNRLKLN